MRSANSSSRKQAGAEGVRDDLLPYRPTAPALAREQQASLAYFVRYCRRLEPWLPIEPSDEEIARLGIEHQHADVRGRVTLRYEHRFPMHAAEYRMPML